MRQVSEAMAMIRALNKMTCGNMLESARIVWKNDWQEDLLSNSYLFNKAYNGISEDTDTYPTLTRYVITISNQSQSGRNAK